MGTIYSNLFKYMDEYKIEINPEGTFAINNECMVIAEQAGINSILFQLS